jgi:hypothetical protein
LVQKAGLTSSYGGIKIDLAKGARFLDSTHLLFDEAGAFSAIMKIFSHDPGTTLFTLLQHLNYPKELQPVAKFLEKSLELSLWIEETRFSYYSTWDETVLKEIHDGIDSAKLCPETFQRLAATSSKEEKYRIVRLDWANCMIKAVDHQLGSYPIDSWNDFLKSYGVTEHYKAKVPD